MKHKYTKEKLQEIISESKSLAEVLKKLNIVAVGGNYQTLKNKIKLFEIDISHFTGRGWNVGLKFRPKPIIKTNDLLKKDIVYQSYKLKLRILREKIKDHRCENCKLTHWLFKDIPLELHHINGDKYDNRLDNLQLLCPNCHAQTDNYRGKNIGLPKEKSLE